MFRAIAEAMRNSVGSGDWTGTKAKADDLEKAWDDGQAQLQRMSPDKWAVMDSAIDAVLKRSRSFSQDAPATSAALQALLVVINSFDHPK